MSECILREKERSTLLSSKLSQHKTAELVAFNQLANNILKKRKKSETYTDESNWPVK